MRAEDQVDAQRAESSGLDNEDAVMLSGAGAMCGAILLGPFYFSNRASQNCGANSIGGGLKSTWTGYKLRL